MAYIVYADLTESLSEAQLLQLADDEKTGAQVTDRVTRVIISAEGIINGYLQSRYVVPVTGTIPDIMQKWAVDIAKYFLYQRRRVPEDVRQAYEDAMAMLRDVSTGKMGLGIEPAPTGSTLFSGGGAVYTEERIFTRDSLASY